MGKLILYVVGIVMAALLAVTMTACGGGNPATADSSPSVSAATASTPAARTAMVTTLAGKAGSAGSTDGTGVAARFDSPEGIACDDFANLYVADAHNCTIRQITPDGKVTTLAGKARAEGSADGRGAAARFFAPSGITRDIDGNLYVTDYLNSTIRKITLAGKVTTLAGKAGTPGSIDGKGAAARFTNPLGIIDDSAGNLYVTDDNANTIRKITPAGEVTTLAGKAGSAGSADGSGAAARFNDPAGMAIDAAGNLYVTDYLNDTIRKVTPAGEVTTLAGQAGLAGIADGMGAAARFAGPTGITRDSDGNLYVSDLDGQTIRKITPAGEVTTVAGQAGSAGSTDGRGAAARFNGPIVGARDAAGSLYISDYNNDTIRKITWGD